ncbi:MAG: phage holin family protein [Candidatus Amulumruptor caecigallinarius]|nr:phage holin family protein [Candidatus Amulumruptor caecigallinarius]
MKNIVDEVKTIFEQSKSWITLEVECAKLTLAEKATILLSSLIIGFVCALMAAIAVVMLALALSEAFKLIMTPSLAYVCTAGIVLLLVLLLYLFRKPILLNPIAKLVTRVIFDKKHS